MLMPALYFSHCAKTFALRFARNMTGAASAAAMAFFVCAGSAAAGLELTVVHVNDTHSYAAGTSSKGLPCYEPQACYGGFGRIASFIKTQKRLHKNVLAFDAGDYWQGTLYFSAGRPSFALELEQAMPYDAITLGNHEFDLGCKATADYISRLGKPVLAANILRAQDCPLAKSPFVPYIIRSFEGTAVAVIGLANDEVVEISKACPHTQFADRKEALQKTVHALQQQGIKHIIVLSHLGYDADQELARSVPDVDLFVGGHTHSVLGSHPASEGPYPTVVESTDGGRSLIVQAGLAARFAGTLTLVFDEDGRVSSYSGELRELSPDMPREAFIDKLVEKQSKVIARALKQNIALAPDMGPDGLDYCREAECPAGMLTADAYLAFGRPAGAVAAIVNSGSIRAGIPIGAVSYADLLSMHPFGNRLMVLDISGETLRKALEHGLSDPDLAGPRLLQTAGIRYRVDAKASIGNRLREVEVSDASGLWRPLSDEKTYRVVLTEYLALGGDKFLMLQKAAENAHDLSPRKGVAEVQAVIDYIKETAAKNGGRLPAITGGRISGLKKATLDPNKK